MDNEAGGSAKRSEKVITRRINDFFLTSTETGPLAQFEMQTACCHNPECDCAELTIDLHDPSRGEHFSVVVPLDQRAPFIRGAQPEAADALIQELRNCFGKAFWDEAKRQYDSAKERGRKEPWTYQSFERGLLVPYYDLCSGPERVMEFACDRRNYLAIDMFCIDPSCDCRKVLLEVNSLRTAASGTTKAEQFALVHYDFQNGRFTPSEGGNLSALRRQVLAALFASRPDMKAYLWERYQRAREIGRTVEARNGFVAPRPPRPPRKLTMRR
ncbi:MAG: hypothetical protein ACO1SX_07660 [Actinomycetota bacterium]